MPPTKPSEAEEAICPQCQSRYELRYKHLPAREAGEFRCEVCGCSLGVWDAPKVPDYRLARRMPWPPNPV